MLRATCYAWILFFAFSMTATANTVTPRRLHRHAHRLSRTAHSGGLTAASRRASKAKTAHAAVAESARTQKTRAAHGVQATSAASLRRSGTRHSHGRAHLQTVRMSRRYPSARRRASLQAVSFRWASPLAGSRESLIHQNAMADAEGLERIQDDADLDQHIAAGALVPVPVNESLRINEDLPENRRYCRPWTADFLRTLAEAHAAEFPRSPLEVTSAVRTVEYQRKLRRINGNAAAVDGDLASPHLTGGTIDLGKKGMSRREIAWMRDWLLPLQQAGKIDVEEEFRQACFHISVYKNFDDSTPDAPATTVADGLVETPGK